MSESNNCCSCSPRYVLVKQLLQLFAEICLSPLLVECRTRLMDDVTVVPWTDTGDVLEVACVTNKGLVCRNSDQIGKHTCRDYELRFLCPPGKI